MIKHISFDQIMVIWKTNLWPNRVSEITPTSAMTYQGGYDYENMKGEPTFFGYYVDDVLVGVNSGHKTINNTYRSRGLFVCEDYRGRGIGFNLLSATIAQAKQENAVMCWSYPKKTSWKSYLYAGFELTSDWEISETSEANAYCKINI
jgi:GNAT superfamily N-acetyltransferase